MRRQREGTQMQVHETQAANSNQPGFDATRRYVRVCEQRPDGFIEFEFAIGDPALCVELMLKEADFHEFCLTNDVIVLGQAEAGQGDWAARMNKASRLERESGDETTKQPEEAPMTKGHTHGN
jgi:phenol hydroxylase P0 protein